MSAELTLFTHPMSRGRIARWMLEEVAEPYGVVALNEGPGETGLRSPDFLAMNPMGKVPVLRHGGVVVTEGAAICAYLADAYPAADLAPPPISPERGSYLRWLFFAAGPMEDAIIDRALGFAVPDDKARMVGYGTFDRMVETVAGEVEQRHYIVGDRFSAADVYFGSQIGWGLQFGTLPKVPALEAYWARLADRPAYRRAAEKDDALIAASA